MDADPGPNAPKASWPSSSPASSARGESVAVDPAAPPPAAGADAQRREVQAALGRRTAPLWPAHATVRPSTTAPTRREWREVHRLAGWERQYHALVLRRISTA